MWWQYLGTYWSCWSGFFHHNLYPINMKRILKTLRPRLAGLHFTSEAIFFGFSSTNSSTGGAEAVLVNRLAKWLPCESMFLGDWRRSQEKPLFLAPFHPKLCESIFLGASSVEPFYFTPFGRKRLLKPLEKPCQMGPIYNLYIQSITCQQVITTCLSFLSNFLYYWKFKWIQKMSVIKDTNVRI